MKSELHNNRILIKFISIILLIICSGSCTKKQDDLIIQGTVRSINEDISLEGVSIELYTRKVESGIFSANYDLFGSVHTSSTGEFSFALPRETWANIKILFAKNGYFNWDYIIEGDVLKSKEGFNETFSLDPKSWLHFKIANTDPQSSGDVFEYRLLNAIATCETCCTGSSQIFSGMDVNEDIICQIIGHQEVLIRWSQTKNSLSTGGTRTLFVPVGDTTIIDFSY